MSKKRKGRRPSFVRLYYGPEGHERELWWTIEVRDATRAVKINGKLIHAIDGQPGSTIGCAMSNTATDPDNVDAFPHPVLLAAFTRSRAIIVDTVRGGSPRTGVRYRHYYGDLIDLNDTQELEKIAEKDPSVVEREFILSIPKKRSAKSLKSGPGLKKTGITTKAFIPRGALRRAQKAGLISKGLFRK
jgi:hypothetical protein